MANPGTTQSFIAELAANRVVRPLERLTITYPADAAGILTVTDGQGVRYVDRPLLAGDSFIVGGAAGTHRAAIQLAQSRVDMLFRVVPTTTLCDAGGVFAQLLAVLHSTMLRASSDKTSVVWNGRVFQCYVSWLRDHVHTLKGMRYFDPDAERQRSAIDLYRLSQRQDGMIWDNIMNRPYPSMWDQRFSDGDFILPIEADGFEFKRIPVENDVEYLFVEGVYRTWQVLGDDAWMAQALDACIRALDYSITSPYRFSQKYKLLKRGFTIDTWDFQLDGEGYRNDPMQIHPEHTRFGIMFGDNLGYAQACSDLGVMLRHVGRADQAGTFERRGQEIRERLDALAWTGRHFIHHVPEHNAPPRELGVNLDQQVSLSNAYALSRGLRPEQNFAIIDTYSRIRDALPAGSPGEWYTIYPPFERGFGGQHGKWQYMNAGVTPIVAGELARGCFAHGAVRYGVDILRRLLALSRRDHSGQGRENHLHCTYTGAMPPPPDRALHCMNLSSQANTDTQGSPRADRPAGVMPWSGEGDNDLVGMPSGRLELAGIPFDVADPASNGRRACVGLSLRAGYARQLTLPVQGSIQSVYLLHTSAGATDGLVGTVTFRYADGTSRARSVLRGRDMEGWWVPEVRAGSNARLGWVGPSPYCPRVGTYVLGVNNPHPAGEVVAVELTPGPLGIWMVFAVTVSDAEVFFTPHPVSYGIPDNWGAAAVVAALLEGLAGVVDDATVMDQVTLSPKWGYADVADAQVCVAYPSSGAYVAYHLTSDPDAKAVRLTIAMSGSSLRVQLPLPAGTTGVSAVEWAGKALPWTWMADGEIPSVSFELSQPATAEVTIRYS